MDTWILSTVYILAYVSSVLGQPCPVQQSYHEGICYQLWNATHKDFIDAQSACATSGGHLTSIPNIRVQEFLQSLINASKSVPPDDGDFWIGLSWDNASASYTWENGANSMYRNWLEHYNSSFNEPFRNETTGGCTTLYHSPELAFNTSITDYGLFKWGDEDCNQTKAYICQYTPNPPMCQLPLMSGYWAIDPDTDINSSESPNDSTTNRSILGTKPDPLSGIGLGSWIQASDAAPGGYLQIKLQMKMFIREIWTQGRHDDDELTSQWTRSFYVIHSEDGMSWHSFNQSGSAQKTLLFIGNYDRDTIKMNVFHQIIRAQYIRIYPVGYKDAAALRVELMGCPVPDTNLTNSLTSPSQGGAFARLNDYFSKAGLITAGASAMTDRSDTTCKKIPTASFHTQWSFQVRLSLIQPLIFMHVLVVAKGTDFSCRQRPNPRAELRPIIRINKGAPLDYEYCDFIEEKRNSNGFDFSCFFFCTCGRFGGGPCTGVVLDVMDTPDLPAASQWAICEVAVFKTL